MGLAITDSFLFEERPILGYKRIVNTIAEFAFGMAQNLTDPVLEVLESKKDGDETYQTFMLHDEDHTLGNALKYILNKNPDVTFVGYSITHPSETKINLRIQTTGKPAMQVLRQGLKDLKQLCGHILTTFESSTKYYKENHMDQADMDQS